MQFSRKIIILKTSSCKHSRICHFWCLNPESSNIFPTFEVNLLNGLPNALLFALEIRNRGVLELEPVLFIPLQSKSLRPEKKSHTIHLKLK